MEVDRATASLLWVEVDLPELPQRVRLDEVALVMDVEAVVNGVVFELCDVPGDIDDGHVTTLAVGADIARAESAPGAPGPDARGWWPMPLDLLPVLRAAAGAAVASLADNHQWGLTGKGDGQYAHDTVADAAVLAVLTEAGLGVFSEEAGVHNPERELLVVVDPVDGSTNASRGLPWWATSLCALDGEGPLAAVVVNQATGQRFEALRGEGATCDGRPVRPSACAAIEDSIVAVSGYPGSDLGWSQFRSLGASALDICSVASGALDVFIDFAERSLAPWDYLGGLLVCREAGACVEDAEGRDLIITSGDERRTVVAAATRELLDSALAARRRGGTKGS